MLKIKRRQMKKFYYKVANRLTILLTIAVLFTSCKDKFDELSGGAENLKLTQIMPASPFAEADHITASENGQYIIFSYQGGTTFFTHYYSINGGQSFELLSGKYSAIGDQNPINTFISNDGKFLYGDQNSKIVYELNPAGGITNSIYADSAFALTASGKVVSYQYDANIGEATYHIFEGGSYISTGLQNVLDPASSFAGISGEKIGFLGNNKVAEFDVSSKEYTERSTDGINFSILKGNSNNSLDIKKAYSEGYFAYAWQRGLLVIGPSNQVTYSYYPQEYQFYLQTRGPIIMDRDKVYVQVYAYYGEPAFYETSGQDGAEMVQSELNYPMAISDKGIFTQGFIEGGNRQEGGLILIENNVSTYLDFSINKSSPNTVFKVGNYLYVDNKRYDIDAKKFYSTDLGKINNMYQDDNHVIAYTEKGTFTSTDDLNWTLQSEDQPRPGLIVKDDNGTLHGLGVQGYIYNLGGTGFGIPQFNQSAYTSTDGINWQLIDEKTGRNGYGPSAVMSDGTTGYIENFNPLGNAVYYLNYSKDYGVTYESMEQGTEPASYKIFDYETRNGRFVNAYFESSDGLLYIEICENNKTTCKTIKVQPPFDSSQSYSNSEVSFTQNDEILINNRQDGIYISSRL